MSTELATRPTAASAKRADAASQKAAALLVAIGEQRAGEIFKLPRRDRGRGALARDRQGAEDPDRGLPRRHHRGRRVRARRGLPRRGRRRLRPQRARCARSARTARTRSSAAWRPRSSAARSSSCAARRPSRSSSSCATSRRRRSRWSSPTCTRRWPPRCSSMLDARGAGRRRPADRDDGRDPAGGRRAGRDRHALAAARAVGRAGVRGRRRRQVARRHPQPLRPHDRAQRARRAGQGRRRAGRGDPPAAVHLRGRRQARRPLDPDGAQGGRPEGPRDRPARRVRGRPRPDLLQHVRARRRDAASEEIDFQPPQRKRVVEEAQGRIVGVVRRLEEAGAIVISRGGGGGEDALV